MFFAAGETTFVVGKSGSGKSTLSGLLLGFYSAKGRLMIDNNSIDKLDRNWLRNNVTVMQQDSILFNGSILHNMAFGLRDTETIGSTVLQECIRYAALEETIMNLPDGINTMVGSGGSLLSGGQRQRIAFARAKLSDTPILVFDEATSALDRKSGDILLRGIREWRRNKTTIIITHDLSHILPDDYVYVMDRGKLVQEGYRDLLETMHGQALFDLLNYKDSKKTALPIIPASPTSSISANTFAFQGKRTQNTSLKACELPADRRNVRRRTMASPLAPLNQTQESSVQERVLPRELHDRKSLSTQSSSRQSLIRPASNLMRPQYDEFRNIIDARFQDDVEKIQPVLLENIDSDSDLDQDIKNLYQKQTMSMYQILSTVWPNLFWTQRIWLLLGYLAAVCHAASTPVFSWVFSKLLATFLSSETNKAQAALKWSLSVLTVAVTDGVLSYLMHYLLESQGQSWVDALRAKAYERILDQPLAWFDDEEHSTHKLVGCLDRSGEEMRNLLGRFVGLMIVAVTMVSIAIIWSLILCWKLTLVGIACGPFIYALTGLFNTMNARWEKKCTDAAQPVSESFNETFGNIRTVRALTLEDHLHHKLSQNTRQAMAAGIKRAAYSGLFFGASDAGVLLTIGENDIISSWDHSLILHSVALLVFVYACRLSQRFGPDDCDCCFHVTVHIDKCCFNDII